MPTDPVAIARELIRCRSVTPDEGGALAYLQGLLSRAGFEVHRAVFAEPGAAPVDYLATHDDKPNGSISLLITGDEESVAVNGTVKLHKWAAERGESFDHCILGEPS